MLNEKEIHLMFYENGKTKDRKDPSKRVTRKVLWPDAFKMEIVQEVFSSFKNKEVKKIDTLPFVANMAYNGLNFVKGLACYTKISYKVILNEDEALIDKSKNEIFAMIGYLLSLRRQLIFNPKSSIILCEPVFKFENYKKILKLTGIKVEDSKIITRSRNTKRILRNSLGYDSSTITLARLRNELDYQIDFFASITDQMCFDRDNENFPLYILRFDLKRCKS